MHNVPAKLDDPLERRSHVRHAEVGKREPIPRPAPALVDPERRPVTVRLDALALGVAARLERDVEQPFPEPLRPLEVIGRKLDQFDRHHPFSLCRVAPVRRYRRSVTTAAEILTARFGYPAFRPGQEQVVDSLLAGRSALAVFPTGAGKSLCYQLPALLLDGVTVVVSPLIALMKDQIDLLARQGVDAARLDSSLDANEVRAVSDRLRDGSLKLLYVAPERFNNERFLAQLGQTKIALFAVDEAHCISEWGHNFRPDYLKLAARARELGAERVLALTATATPAVVADICAGFGIEERDSVVTGFYRPNLTLLTTPVRAQRARPGADRPPARARARLDDRLRDAAAHRRARRGAARRRGPAGARLPRGHERRRPRRGAGVVDAARTRTSSSRRSRSAWGSTRPTCATSTT